MRRKIRSAFDLPALLMIRGNERTSVGDMGIIFFLLGVGLAIGQGMVYALFLKRYGIDYLPVMYIVLGFVLAPASFFYFAFINRYPAERILHAGFVVFGGLLIFSWGLLRSDANDVVYPLLFIVYEVASEWLIIHSSLYLSQNFDTTQVKRIGPVIFGTWQVGIITGGFILGAISPVLGLSQMTLIWVALLALAMLLVYRRHRIHGVSRLTRLSAKGRFSLHDTLSNIRQGLGIMWNTELVRAAALAMFFLVITIYILIYLVNRIYNDHYTSETELSAFLGWLILFSGSFTLFLQFFLTSRIIQRLGVAKANSILPIALFGSFGALAISFTLPSAILGTLCKDVLLPGIHRPSRHVLLNAIPSTIHASMRALLLVLVVPLALICGGILLSGIQRFDLPLAFVGLGLLASGCLGWFTWRANRAYPNSVLDSLRQQVFVPDANQKPEEPATSTGNDRYTLTGDAKTEIAHAHLLQHAIDILGASTGSNTGSLRGVRLLRIVLGEHLTETIQRSLQALAKIEDPSAVAVIRAGVDSEDPQSRALACEALHNLRNRSLAMELSGLIDRGSATVPQSQINRNKFATVDDVTRWCQQHTNPWLRLCADFALAQLAGEPYRDQDLLERILTLKITPIFNEVNTHELHVVARELSEASFRAGQRVFDINDPSDRFYIIEHGEIGISTHPDPRKQHFVTVLGAGACLGEIGCFEQRLRSATAHVLRDSVLLALEKAKLRGLILEHPQLSLGLLRGLSARLRTATSELGSENNFS